MKNVIFKGIKALAILFVLYILISLIVPPIFQKEPIELEGAEFAGTGVTERVLCIDDNREALIWRLRLIDRAENEIILSTFDFRVDNSGKDMIAALNEAAERGVNIKILVDGISGDMYLRCNRLIGALAANTNVQIKLYNPINLMTPWKINYRLHDKYLIVDGKQYLLGGRNTNDLFLGEYKDKEDRNIDREVLVCSDGTNSSTEALTAYFAKIWDLPCNKEISGNRRNLQKAQETLRTHYTELQGSYAEAYLPVDLERETLEAKSITLLSNPTSPENKAPVLWEQLSGIMKNGESILIETPYIICNNGMYETLAGFCEGGRRVQIMTNAIESGANPFGCTDYLNEKKNILATGSEVFEVSCGQSLHTKTILVDDHISMIGSYNLDLRSTYLDAHRDAFEAADGTLGGTAADGRARIMLVVGTDERGLTHPNWQGNLSFALKLETLLRRRAPGLSRGISLCAQRYNQNLTPLSLLAEFGAAGDTLEEALAAVPDFAAALAELLAM